LKLSPHIYVTKSKNNEKFKSISAILGAGFGNSWDLHRILNQGSGDITIK
jgi:hypothetical protein